MRNLPMRSRGRHAFTLIELLVVVGILSVLVAVMLPSLAEARARGKTVVCLNRMRELGHFTSAFNQEHDDRMPLSMHSRGRHVMFPETSYFGRDALPWGAAFFRYVTGRSLVSKDGGDPFDSEEWLTVLNGKYRCPFDRRRDRNAWSYGYNVYYELQPEETGTAWKPGPTWWLSSKVARPAQTVLFGELADDGAQMPDHAMAHFWVKYGTTPEVSPDRHGKGSGYVFVDAHAENLEFEQVFDREVKRDNWNPATAR